MSMIPSRGKNTDIDEENDTILRDSDQQRENTQAREINKNCICLENGSNMDGIAVVAYKCH